MEFNVLYSELDYLEFKKLDFEYRPQKNTYLVLGIIFVIIAILRLVYFIFDVSYYGYIDSPLVGAIIFIIFTFILGLVYLFYPHTLLPFKSKLMFKASPNLHVNTTFTVSDKDIKLSSNGAISTIPWTNFVGFLYNKYVLVLYPTPVLGYIIPRRCVGNDQNWNQLLALASHNIKGARF